MSFYYLDFPTRIEIQILTWKLFLKIHCVITLILLLQLFLEMSKIINVNLNGDKKA